MSSGNVHQKLSVGVKRKKWTARAYKSLIRKPNTNKVPDHSKDSRTSSVDKEIMGNSSSVPSKYSPANSKNTTPQSAECENCSLLGTCILCSKEKRINYNSPEKELCTCNTVTQNDLDSSSIRKDKVAQKSSEKCHCGNMLKEIHSGRKMDGHGTRCALCNKAGELLCCEGKECKIRYHLSCLDPLLPDDLPGISHCPRCVSKKLEFGVYSVSEGVESIWDVREVDISNAKGTKQRQYLVKYQGLAHIHNHWIPAKKLSPQNQSLVSNFCAKDERWTVDWTVPDRLLRKRSILDKCHTEPTADIPEIYEWLVKWKGLDYDHATWELDSSHFLSLDRDLVTAYEIRREKAKREVEKGYFVELSELPGIASDVNNMLLLKNVNKLREYWYKSQNAVVFDNQDRATTLVSFIQSLVEFCHPFLVVAPSDSLSQWEAEFARLAPSVDVVVYNGSIDTRKGIRASEFYEEGGCVMLQVLLSSPEAVSEDKEMLSCIKWQSIVIDKFQHCKTYSDLEQIRILSTDSRILLLSGQIKNTTSEYLSILSLLDSEQECNKLRALRSEKTENLAKMKERLSLFIAYGSTSEASKFLEYWVPIQISNYQLEQYCSALISKSILLCSSSRNDKFGALRDILLTVRKCCDHPYLVDSSIQDTIYKRHPATEVSDVRIKASGKLQLLEMMLTQIKARDLKVLVIFQSAGSGGCEMGYILCDFLVGKFGSNSYELVFGGASPSKKQAAVNRFNNGNEKFVLLLEKSACASNVKLSSLDAIILYNSDWNPKNDLKALQKIYYDLAVDRQIKIFRLYSSFTVEERALNLAKKNLNLDNNLQASSRSSIDSLLMWGASCLFSRLDEYHAERSSDLSSKSGHLLLNEVAEEFGTLLSECGEISERVPVISNVKLDVASYSADIQMLGEAKVQLTDLEEPHVFWKKLLDNRTSPQWMHIMEQSLRNRKRVLCMDVSLVKSDAGQKRRRAMVEDVYQASAQVEIQENQETDQVSGSGEDNPDDVSSGPRTFSPEFIKCAPEERNASSDEQKSLRSSLKVETQRLCQTLKLSDDVTQTLRRFLDYVILNHSICRDTPTIMQAYQISLLWISASIMKQEVDKTKSLILAKQSLNYQCTEEQVWSVYSKMLDLMRMYLHSCSLNTTNSGAECSLAEENTKKKILTSCEQTSPSLSFEANNAKVDIEENSANDDPHYDKVNIIQRECEKRKKKLIQEQMRETREVYRIWEVKKLKLETDHKLASALIRCIYAEGSARVVNLKLLDAKFAAEMEENNLLKDVELKDLEAKQLDAKNEEIKKASQWIAEAKACINQLKLTGNIISSDLMASGEGVPIEMGPIETNKELPSERSENVPLVRQILEEPPEQSESSLHRCDFFPQQVLPEDQIQQSSSSNLPEQGAQVLDDQKTYQFEVSASRTIDSETLSLSNCKLKDQGAPAPFIDDHGTLQIEGSHPAQPLQSNIDVNMSNYASPGEKQSTTVVVEIQRHNSAPETVILPHEFEGTNPAQGDTVTPLQSNTDVNMSNNASPGEKQSTTVVVEVQRHNSAPETVILPREFEGTNPAQGDTVTPLQSNTDVNVSNNASPGEKQSTTIVDEIQSHNSALETVNLPHESDSQTVANLKMQNNAEPVVGTVEHSNEAILLQLGIDLGCDGASWDSPSWDSPSLSSKPLQYELNNIQKETEHLKKCHEEMILHLNSECEKKIQETTAQVLQDYKVKIQDAEAEYISKKNGLKENYNKVFRNKILAKAFSCICEDLQPSGLPGIHQDFPPRFVHHRNQPSVQHSERHPPGPMHNLQAFRHAANLCSSQEIIHAPSPQLQSLRPASNLHSSQQIMYDSAPQLQAFRPVANLHSSQEIIHAPSPQLQALRPAANLRSSQEFIHAPSPQHQAFRPAANLRSSPEIIYDSTPQLQAYRPDFPPLIPRHNSQQLLPSWNLQTTSQNRPEYRQSGPPPPWGPLPEMELPRNLNSRPRGSFFFGHY